MISSSNSTYRGRPPKQKPLTVIVSNNEKTGIDRSDQYQHQVVSKTSTTFTILLGTTAVNALIVYQTATNKNIQINKFREILASEWSNVSSENTVRQPSEENEEGVSPFGDS